MKIRDAVIDMDNIDPEKLIFELSERFHANSHQIIERQKLDSYFVETADAEECLAAYQEIWHQDFEAYQANDIRKYKDIDRETPFTKRGIANSCKFLERVTDPEANSWFLSADIPQGSHTKIITKPELTSSARFREHQPKQHFINDSQTISIRESFSSRLFIWAWVIPGTSTTRVYMEARPVNDQVVSCDDCGIDHTWWKQTNGYAEYRLVKNYIFLLEELKRSRKLH